MEFIMDNVEGSRRAFEAEFIADCAEFFRFTPASFTDIKKGEIITRFQGLKNLVNFQKIPQEFLPNRFKSLPQLGKYVCFVRDDTFKDRVYHSVRSDLLYSLFVYVLGTDIYHTYLESRDLLTNPNGLDKFDGAKITLSKANVKLFGEEVITFNNACAFLQEYLGSFSSSISLFPKLVKLLEKYSQIPNPPFILKEYLDRLYDKIRIYHAMQGRTISRKI